ncbi:MAG TPA: copper resistance system multicopper oxidase [Gammaproteobacteria bacterium]
MRKPARSTLNRRRLLQSAALAGVAWSLPGLLPAWARSATAGVRRDVGTLSGERIELIIGRAPFVLNGRTGQAVVVNGTIPGPLIRLREGQTARIAVTNALPDEDTSIHWHGVLVPFQMDGVPGVSFPGIRPGETFEYTFPVRHAGTFWYHSHSGLQEQLGHYGPLILDPAGPDPVRYDREHVIVLSDWTFMHPHRLVTKLKKEAGYFNYQRLTLAGLLRGGPEEQMPAAERRQWRRMRMDPTDIADVTAAAYTYLVNGHAPEENWTALFTPGERVRLRIINASAMTLFNVRIPDLPMTVVNADGNDVRPVETDELQIAVAETYDVIVAPGDRAYTLVAESVDRSGLGRATLAPRPGMAAPVPPLRPRPTLAMSQFHGHAGAQGAEHAAAGDRAARTAAGDHAGHAGAGTAAGQGDHAAHSGSGAGAAAGDRAAHVAAPPEPRSAARMSMRDAALAPPHVKVGVGVDMIAASPRDGVGMRGLGLEDAPHRVLVYADLEALEPNPDPRPPSRELEIHLTGNMERFMWSFDGRKFNELVEPIRLARDERVRITLVNDTMMQHPMHLHGHFFEIVNGRPGRHPRKHTVNVPPGSKITFDLTASFPGDWAFHCHLLFHMHAGMFNVVSIRPLDGASS